MTVFMPVGSARTMDFNANDVGFVPANTGHYVENTGDTDLVFLEMFKASEVLDFSLNQWIRRLPPEMVKSHLKLDKNAIQLFRRKSWRFCRDSSSLVNPLIRGAVVRARGGVCNSQTAMFLTSISGKNLCSKDSCSPHICW